MNFYFNNNDLAQDELKRFAERYCTSQVVDGGDVVQSSAKAMARCQLEIWALANRRARAALSFPSQLAACKSPDAFMSAYVNFWQSAFSECADTTHRVGGLLASRENEAIEQGSEKEAPEVVKVIKSDRSKNKLNGVRAGQMEELRQAP